MISKKAKLLALNFDTNTVEVIRDTGVTISKTVKEELRRETNLAWEMTLGLGEFGAKRSGEMQQGEEISLARKQQDEKTKLKGVEGGINYTSEIIHAEKKTIQETNREIKISVQEILIELKKIKGMSKEIETQFKDVDTINLPETPGKYHLNFFEWVLSVVRNARMKIEDSKAWLSSAGSRSSKKDHWTTNKKQGTQFGLSGERTVATQTG
ncbi:MAG: hypothetical protein COY68_02200 [Candidatus Levybacteria bacterium CG_4_10_14_0_8_um_filter_35_23]|nr:MAG: hypothetical protein COY68_02200 [Candidatus Levybacteria bacterium CG_4_10_14_0_8_um_filter_35_23]PJC54154.1 MAG: hypothetical protein CO028_03945 [Candidatus Levybacteria bacterium CG_4_9_14_0_2_um_filter_35_21]